MEKRKQANKQTRKEKTSLILFFSLFSLSPLLFIYMFRSGLAGDHFAQLSEADVITEQIKQPDNKRGPERDQVINDRDAGGEIWV
jgi:hypothetical protein